MEKQPECTFHSNVQVSNTHEKMLLVTRKMQIKTTVEYHCTLTIISEIRKAHDSKG